MAELRKILGTSMLSLLLVIWGLFMVCSGRVPDVSYEDDISANEGEQNGDYDPDLMRQLAVLDEESTKLEDYQRSEILQALGIDPMEAESNGTEDDFLSEELFLDLEVQIADLERRSRQRSDVIDSLKAELHEADLRVAALDPIVDQPGAFASKTPPPPSPSFNFSNGSSSEFQLAYQDALDQVYAHRYNDAIARFRELLRQDGIGDLADNCQYWIGESYYALGSYQLAITEFERVFIFDENNKADDAQFMIGLAYLKLGDSGLAQIELNNLTTFYQNSEYVARALREMGDLNI